MRRRQSMRRRRPICVTTRGAAATAGSVKDARGKQMEDKIDKALKQTNAEGRNGKAIRAPKQ